MPTAHREFVSVLVGPTCPTCEADDLMWGAPLGASPQGRCPDCGTSYRRYGVPPDDGEAPEPQPAPTCPGCGGLHDESETGTVFCEDCGPSDCAFCGITTLRWMLSENLACSTCEGGEEDDGAAAA